MKEYILKPNMTLTTLIPASTSDKPTVARSVPPRQPLPVAVIDSTKPMLKLGLDVPLAFIMAVAQKDHASPQAPRKFARAELVVQVAQWIAEGLQVFCVQESCGFGFVLHRELVAAGAQSFLITPIALNGKRKTDELDARALCLRLARWLEGNRDELAPIRIPAEAEQRRREGTRRRKFLGRLIRMLGNRGHGQVAEHAFVPLPSRWWGARNWEKLSTLDPWLLGVLQGLREVILGLEAQLEQLEAELVARVKGQVLPKGLGEISLVTLDGEVCDWGRFHNRKAIGSYPGCCPGEYSSGGKQRLGSIDRMGNGRVRTILVEAVWRLLRWQPQWHAAQRMKVKLAEGGALKKKTVVALARLLAIDLWRWRTGRATFADLGWVAA
ncbi:MAG: IS110 family transposase [Pedosphaera sp.]|nr:IS110 family transposase [Pedosphaera sp.]